MPEPNAEDWSERVLSLREAHGLTQEELSGLLGVSFATINRWENGHCVPNYRAQQKIVALEAREFSIPPAAHQTLLDLMAGNPTDTTGCSVAMRYRLLAEAAARLAELLQMDDHGEETTP